MERGHSSCSQKEQFFCLFLMHLARQKVQMTFFFLERWRSEKNKKNCSFCGESHSSCSQKEQFFFCPFLMHLARQKVQMTFFSRNMTLRKEHNNCSFCAESHSSCSQKEQFFFPFLMHLARQKVRSFLERWVQKEQNNCSFCGAEPFFMYVQKGTKGTIWNNLSFSDAFGKAKSTNDLF